MSAGVGNIAQGTVIATFSGPNTYSGHLAIFDRYFDIQGKILAFRVWDQNYVSPHAVGRHVFLPSGDGVYNANNYYVVQTP